MLLPHLAQYVLKLEETVCHAPTETAGPGDCDVEWNDTSQRAENPDGRDVAMIFVTQAELILNRQCSLNSAPSARNSLILLLNRGVDVRGGEP